MMWRWLGFLLLVLLLSWCMGPLCAALLLGLPCLAWYLLGGGGRAEPSLDVQGRAVFITGCDSGFGKLLAARLHRMGCSVFAGCLFPEGHGAQELLREATELGGPARLQIIPLNVCSDSDIARAKELLKSQLSETGLWALVNNAGISTWGNADWFSIEKYKQVVDVNLLGSIRTTLAFLPLLKKQKGRMIFMSSTNAYMTSKNGIYSMTKAALEKFCDSLRLDMKMFGIQVSIIEPGNYSQATNIQLQRPAEDIWNEFSEELKEIYNMEYVQRLTDVVNTNLKGGSNKAYEVIDAIVDSLTSAAPRARYMVASLKEKIMVYMFLICPTAWLDAIVFSQIK